MNLPPISRRSSGFRTFLACSLLAWCAATARAQVTLYSDEASFNAASANLKFVESTFEGIAPAGGSVQDPDLSPLTVVYQDAFDAYALNEDIYDATGASGVFSLNGSADLVIPDDGVNPPTTIFALHGSISGTLGGDQVTAFGTEVGFRDSYGGSSSSAGVNDFPLTDKLDVQLYEDGVPVGQVFHLASFATGYVGFVSAVPFNRVAFTTISAPLPYIDGYPVPDPYHQVYDNVRFAAVPLPAYSLYVADLGTSVIYGYSATGAQSPFATDLDGPTALAFDAAGNLYEGDAGTGIIYKAAASGGQTVFASGLGQIYGLAFDASGNLFAAATDANKVGSITRITPAGVQSPFATGLTRVRGLAFDGSGNLYEAELDTGSVSRYTPAGVKSTFASGFNFPTGIAFDATGNLFVCSQGVGVFKVTPAGAVSPFTTNVTDPRYLAFDATGNLYVTDVGDATGTPGQGNVYKFAPNGTRATFASNLAFPAGIVLTAAAPNPSTPPAITSAASATAQVGKPFSYQITASRTPTRFSASGLPAGLSVDALRGLISGTPTASGTFAVGLSAANADGTGSATLHLVVAAAPVVLPSVSLVATIPQVTAGSGDLGEFTLGLSAAQDHDIVVALTIKGSAANGTDYVLIKSTKKIKAGRTSKPIKVTPLGAGAGSGVKRAVVLTVQPGDGYTVGTTGKVKVKIFGQ